MSSNGTGVSSGDQRPLSRADGQTLSIDNLHKRYGSHEVLKGLNLNIEPNSIVGLVGLNGSGKTTTVECLLGLQRFQEGSIDVLGKVPSRVFELKGRVAAVYDHPCLYPGLTVRQNGVHTQFVLGDKNDQVAEIENSLGLTRYQRFKTKKLSFGNKRRLAIAQALLGSPEFVVFDEPFIGLDAEGVEDVLNLIQEVNRRHEATFLLASHQLPYLERICTHIAILHEGVIVLHDLVENLLASSSVSVSVRSSQCHEVVRVAESNPKLTLSSDPGDGTVELALEDMTSAELNALLVLNGIAVSELIEVRQTLNSLFRSITHQDPSGSSESVQ